MTSRCPCGIHLSNMALSLALAFFFPASSVAKTGREIAAQSFPSVVLLTMSDRDEQPVSLASGFYVMPDVVATSYHVVKNASKGYAKPVGSQKKQFEILGTVAVDPKHDLALLSVGNAKGPPLIFGDETKLNVGDEVFVIGNPLGLEGSLSEGIVSGIRKVGSDTILQITAPVSPGSSGGPVLDRNGQVVGVATASFQEGQNLNFAIPAKYLSELSRSQGSLKPLGPVRGPGKEASVLEGLGADASEGVSGVLFAWGYGFRSGSWGPTFTYTLRNNLGQPVKAISGYVVFLDSTGKAIDAQRIRCDGTILPGMATRLSGYVDSSVVELKPRVEIRVLDFHLAK